MSLRWQVGTARSTSMGRIERVPKHRCPHDVPPGSHRSSWDHAACALADGVPEEFGGKIGGGSLEQNSVARAKLSHGHPWLRQMLDSVELKVQEIAGSVG